MSYDFNREIDRKNTDCVKWDILKSVFGREDILPMWVADMDFPCPDPVVDAIKKRAEHPVYGYTEPSDSCKEAVVAKVKKAYGYEILKEWLVFCDGVVGGVYSAVKAVTKVGDSVILQEPVYYPFFNAIEDNGCRIINSPLILKEPQYEMNYEDLRSKFIPENPEMSSSRVRAMILCSPHNPVGRVWKLEELLEYGNIALKHNAIVISDEIHCDLIYKGNKHIMFPSIKEEFQNNSITFISPSKTFNVAGLSESVAIIPNPVLRDKFIAARAGNSFGNVFGLTALEAAYNFGDSYLKELITYIEGNKDYFIEYVQNNIKSIEVIKPQGTYLLWVDMRKLLTKTDDLNHFIINKAGLGLDDGRMFGPCGEGFMRFNIACPRSYVKLALEKLKEAIDTLG